MMLRGIVRDLFVVHFTVSVFLKKIVVTQNLKQLTKALAISLRCYAAALSRKRVSDTHQFCWCTTSAQMLLGQKSLQSLS